MYAPRAWRIGHIEQSMGVDAKTAEAEVDRVDRSRAAYLRDWYGATFGDPHGYDLCIDTSRLSETRAAGIVVTAVRARE
ncbi:MAG TPA: cytidylate kinase family protein, partial [Candidatus Baltobacteraceae bacterium]|nr:cytidylate kinase family protein [Candidatus Baltobacteraceae bacterium]